MPSKTTTPTALPSTAPSLPKSPVPPPQTFDVLPRLHFLLSRLVPPQPTSYKELTPLSPKDLETQASEVKIHIQKAKGAADQLPDMDRGLEQQEDEIRELQAKVRSLQRVLEEIGKRAGESAEET